VPLFEGIYADLFPGIELPQRECDVLVRSLRECIALHNLQATPSFMQKIVQVYDMILARHGLIIVGLPMGGKTQLYQVCIVYGQKCLLVILHYNINIQGL
jgi:dynein heavy chain